MIRRMMTRWTLSPASVLLLGGMIVLMLLIVVLPDDVDLPDAAFHRGTAPIAVHAQATSVPATFTVSAPLQVPLRTESFPYLFERTAAAVYSIPNFRPILLRTIRR
jgi:hypothetical protein